MSRKGPRKTPLPQVRGGSSRGGYVPRPLFPGKKPFELSAYDYVVTHDGEDTFIDVTNGVFKGKHFMISWNPEWSWRPDIDESRPLWFLLDKYGQPLAHDQAVTVKQTSQHGPRTWLFWEIAG